jgi:hypothetical protein
MRKVRWWSSNLGISVGEIGESVDNTGGGNGEEGKGVTGDRVMGVIGELVLLGYDVRVA